METKPWNIILGPPGCGKTTHLMNVLDNRLANGSSPERIAFITFTRQAAEVAQDRVAERFNLPRAAMPHFRTIHSLCMRFVGMAKGDIIEGPKINEFADWIGERITGRVAVDGVWTGYAPGDRMMFMSNLARIRRVPLRQLYEEDHDELDWMALDRFDRGYAEYKRHNQLYDFTDMLELFVAGGKRPEIDTLIVDEAQDLSSIQWDVVRALAQNCDDVYIAGDDDQAIFEWAGADVETLISMPGATQVLGQSYRVPRRVQATASRVISRIGHRREKAWNPRDAEGIVRHIRSIGDADYSGPSTMILARNRYQLDGLEAEMRATGTLYSREGVLSVKRSTLDAIVVWERLRRGEPQMVENVVKGPYEMMTVGAGVVRGAKRLPSFHPKDMVTMSELKEKGGLRTDAVWHVALDKMTAENRLYLMKCRRNGERLTQPPRVRLSTIHGAKGGEAERVVLLTDLAARTWREMHTRPDAENRVLYVGLTRAISELNIVAPSSVRRYDV